MQKNQPHLKMCRVVLLLLLAAMALVSSVTSMPRNCGLFRFVNAVVTILFASWLPYHQPHDAVELCRWTLTCKYSSLCK